MGSGSARAATPGDYGLFTHFFAALDAPSTPDREWWERSHGDALFLEEDGEVIGYAFAYRLGRELGHVGHVVVDAPLRGRGLGRVVMNAVRERLRSLGCRRWELYVNEGNLPAIALYRRCGLQVTSPVEEIGVRVADLGTIAIDPRVQTEPLDTENDSFIERTFQLPEGRIARVRRLPGRSFFVARQNGIAVGTIAFEPSSRSTPFLCAESPAVARALIEAVASEGDVRLFVHDDVALSKALIDAGGHTLRHMLQMEGSLA
jgi:GNAT superfamily N-acetyltransferase